MSGDGSNCNFVAMVSYLIAGRRLDDDSNLKLSSVGWCMMFL